LYTSRVAPLIFHRWRSHQRILVDPFTRDQFTENGDDFTKPYPISQIMFRMQRDSSKDICPGEYIALSPLVGWNAHACKPSAFAFPSAGSCPGSSKMQELSSRREALNIWNIRTQGYLILVGVKLLKNHSTYICLSFAKERLHIQTRDLVIHNVKMGVLAMWNGQLRAILDFAARHNARVTKKYTRWRV
jgi:hypothetical protein